MKVLITGPESSGKSTLARALAWCLDGVFVAEQARAYLTARLGRYTAADLHRIWAAQRAAEDAAVATGASYVFCDTGPEVIKVWSEVKYGSVDPTVAAAVHSSHYDLTLLCKPDLPWTPDPLRETPDLEERLLLFERYRHLLPDATVIEGRDRVTIAIASILGYF